MMDLSTSGRRRVRQPVLPGIIEAALSLHAEIESDVDVDVRLVSRKKRKTPNSTFLFKHLSRNIDFAICPQTLKNSIYHYISIYFFPNIFLDTGNHLRFSRKFCFQNMEKYSIELFFKFPWKF